MSLIREEDAKFLREDFEKKLTNTVDLVVFTSEE